MYMRIYGARQQSKAKARVEQGVWSTPAEGKDRNCGEENAHNEGHDRPSELGQLGQLGEPH